jgi:hypothetical protein
MLINGRKPWRARCRRDVIRSCEDASRRRKDDWAAEEPAPRRHQPVHARPRAARTPRCSIPRSNAEIIRLRERGGAHAFALPPVASCSDQSPVAAVVVGTPRPGGRLAETGRYDHQPDHAQWNGDACQNGQHGVSTPTHGGDHAATIRCCIRSTARPYQC